MIIVYTVPLWLGAIILLLRLFAENSSKRLVDRQITAPDGRQATFRVPFDEPPAVSVARMYPGSVVPSYPTESNVSPPLVHRQSMQVTYREKRPLAVSVQRQWVWIGAGLFAAIIAIASLVNSRNAYYATAPVPVQPAAQSVLVQNGGRGPSSVQRVRLKTGANVRQGPSISAGVSRVAQKGEILNKFSETSNGWLQIGSTLIPDGWIAKSVAESVN